MTVKEVRSLFHECVEYGEYLNDEEGCQDFLYNLLEIGQITDDEYYDFIRSLKF